MENSVCPMQPPFFCFVDLFIFGFYTIKSLLSSACGWGLDIIWQCQWMRGTAWDKTPQACCGEPAWAGCQEWLMGPSGTSLRHLTSALQLSQDLTLSRLKTHMELRLGRASGMWSITLPFYKNISIDNISLHFFHYIEWKTFGNLSVFHVCMQLIQMHPGQECDLDSNQLKNWIVQGQ